MTRQELLEAMKNCEQVQGQTILEHGISVYNYFLNLENLEKYPKWFEKYKDRIYNNLHSADVIEDYLIMHDCGKPFCKSVDTEGKVHFPNHAEVSAKIYQDVCGNEVVARLIGWDMCIHTCSAEEIDKYCQIWSIKDACTLLLAALAEIYSNAQLFGGCNSDGFKIKFKKLEQRGKQICKIFFGE